LSRWVWNISREGDSTASLGSLGQGSVTLRGKKFFLMFRQNFLCSETAGGSHKIELHLHSFKCSLERSKGEPEQNLRQVNSGCQEAES